jgi:hypothetical protein
LLRPAIKFFLYRNTSAEAIFILTTSLEEADDKSEANIRLKVYARNLLKVLSESADAEEALRK